MNIDTSLLDRNLPTDDIRWAPSAEMSCILGRPIDDFLRLRLTPIQERLKPLQYFNRMQGKGLTPSKTGKECYERE